MIRELIHLVRQTQQKLLLGIIPSQLYEVDYDNESYTACVVMAPNKEKIMGFSSIWDNVKNIYGSKLVPAYLLVSNGSGGSYFVIFIRK